MTTEAAIRLACYDEHNLKTTANYLRTLVINVKKTKTSLPDPLTACALSADKGNTPQQLIDFFTVLFCGTEEPNDRIARQIQSVCDDVMYITSRGRIQSSKHLCMGLGLKSLTGNRQVIDIMNRFGHSIGYHTTERLETELASVITDKQQATPDGMRLQSGLCTGIAWDNYDENSETLSGGGTLHDTVGFCYQNLTTDTADIHVNKAPVSRTAKPKRSLLEKETVLEPYRKKPKIKTFQYQEKDIPRPLEMTKFELRDILWMINIALGQTTPMWTGWNSLFTNESLPCQRVLYRRISPSRQPD